MPELSLSVCPICNSTNSVTRQEAAVPGQEIVWYECRLCSSFLLWAGTDQWIYQKVGRQEKAHLLRRALSTAEVEAMAQSVAAEPVKAPEPDEPCWGARVNTGWRRGAADYPRWAHRLDQEKWGETGLIVWHRDSKTITKLRATESIRLLDFLRTKEAWKEQGIEVFETPVQLKLGDPDWKPEDPRVNLIALAPSQVLELLDLLANNETELRRMSEAEEKDRRRRLAQVYDLILGLGREKRAEKPPPADDEP